MKQALIAGALVLVLGIALYSLQHLGQSGESGDGTLMVYCAAGVKKPVAEIARRYRDELGVDVQIQYGGTSTLLSQVQIAKRGDLFIAADETAVEAAREKGAVHEVLRSGGAVPGDRRRGGQPEIDRLDR